MKTYLIMLGVSLFGVVLSADAPCGGNLMDHTGDFTTPTKDPGANNTCTWLLKSTETSPTTMIQFSSLLLTSGTDQVAIYAGNGTTNLIKKYTIHSGPTTVVSPTQFMTIVLTRGANENMTASFTGKYNTKECVISTSGAIHGNIKSPVYLPGPGKITCNYDVTMAISTDTVIVAFTTFNIPSGTVQVAFDTTSLTAFKGKGLPADSFGAPGTKKIIVKMDLENSTDAQEFSAVFFTASPDCSKKYKFDEHFVLPITNQVPIICYAQISLKNPDEFVFLNVEKAGSDSIKFLDGGNIMDPVIGSLSKGDGWFVTSGNIMTIRASLEPTKIARTIKFTRTSSKTDRLYHVEKPVSVNLSAAIVSNTDVHMQFDATSNPRMSVIFDKTTSLAAGTTILLQNRDGFNFALTKDSVFFPVPVPGDSLLFVIQNFNDSTVNFKVILDKSESCEMLYSDADGSVNWLPPKAAASCTLVIQPVSADLGKTDIVFDFGAIIMCDNSTIDVYQGLNKGPKLTTFKGRYISAAQIVFPNNVGARFVWTRDPKCERMNGPVMSAMFWTHDHGTTCARFVAQPSKLTTPNFPNQYPLNVHCNRPITHKNNTVMYLQVTKLDLNPAHALTVQRKVGENTTDVLKITGTSLPGDVVMDNKQLYLDFKSIPMTDKSVDLPGQGISASFKILSCGGSFTTDKATIASPTKNSTAECIWIISLPANGKDKTVNIVSANIAVVGYKNASSTVIEIRDGNSARDKIIDVNYTNTTTQTLLSRTNFLWVRYAFTKPANLVGATGVSLVLKYTTYKCSKLCDNGICMHPDWVCDGTDHCGDSSDEKDCVYPNPKVKKTGVSGVWIPICLALGLLFGIVAAILVPRIYAMIRKKRYATLRNVTLET